MLPLFEPHLYGMARRYGSSTQSVPFRGGGSDNGFAVTEPMSFTLETAIWRDSLCQGHNGTHEWCRYQSEQAPGIPAC